MCVQTSLDMNIAQIAKLKGIKIAITLTVNTKHALSALVLPI